MDWWIFYILYIMINSKTYIVKEINEIMRQIMGIKWYIFLTYCTKYILYYFNARIQ